MNSCDLCLENLSAFLDGELSEADKQSFEQHIQTCEACAAELAMMKAILSSASELEEELPEGFEASLHKRLEAAVEEAAAKKNRVVKIRMFSQIAAGFVVVIALGLVIRSGLFMQKNSDLAQSPMMATGSAGGQMAASEATNSMTEEIPQPPSAQADMPSATAMKSMAAPSGPDRMMDDGLQKTEEKIVIESQESMYSMAFTGASLDRMEGYDTFIRIQAADISKALDSIIAIEKKLDNGGETNRDNLESSKQKYADAMDQPVEIKIYYSNDELWQQFLAEMQGVFPDMVVESAEALEDQQFIRVVIEKVE